MFDRVDFAGVAHLAARVLAHRLVQAVTRNTTDVVPDHQRLVDERREKVQGFRCAADRLNVFQRESAGEHAEAPEQRPLVLRQQLVAPVDRSLERLMAGQRCAASAREQREAVGEPIEDLLDVEDTGADGRELDRER